MTRLVTEQEQYIFVVAGDGLKYIAFNDPDVIFTQNDVEQTENPELFGVCQLIENGTFCCEQTIEFNDSPENVNTWPNTSTVFYLFEDNFVGHYPKPVGRPRP